jgi:hypothetical protein
MDAYEERANRRLSETSTIFRQRRVASFDCEARSHRPLGHGSSLSFLAVSKEKTEKE